MFSMTVLLTTCVCVRLSELLMCACVHVDVCVSPVPVHCQPDLPHHSYQLALRTAKQFLFSNYSRGPPNISIYTRGLLLGWL